jgi:hypothetical protein
MFRTLVVLLTGAALMAAAQTGDNWGQCEATGKKCSDLAVTQNLCNCPPGQQCCLKCIVNPGDDHAERDCTGDPEWLCNNQEVTTCAGLMFTTVCWDAPPELGDGLECYEAGWVTTGENCDYVIKDCFDYDPSSP